MDVLNGFQCFQQITELNKKISRLTEIILILAMVTNCHLHLRISVTLDICVLHFLNTIHPLVIKSEKRKLISDMRLKYFPNKLVFGKLI